MWALLVIECQVALHALVRTPNGVVGVQIDLLVSEAFPESFYQHGIPPTPFSIHADLDAVVRQESRELLAGELAALIGVEDGRGTMLSDRLLDRLQAEVGGQPGGHPPRQHPATGPVEHGEQIHEAPRHRNVGYIRRPDMIGTIDRQIAEEIRIDGCGPDADG